MESAKREPEVKRYCDSCGAKLRADSAYCPKCGSEQVAVPTLPMDWRDPRQAWRARAREVRYGRLGVRLGGLLIVVVIMVAGVGFLLGRLPWEALLGSLITLPPAWVGYVWFERHRLASALPLPK
jgi:zinc-ribbon domain